MRSRLRLTCCIVQILILITAAGAQVRSKQVHSGISIRCQEHSVLGEYQWGTFISAEFGKRDIVAMQLLSREGCGSALFDALAKANAQILFADPKVGYALILFPKLRVFEVADLPGLEDAEVAGDEPGYANPYQNAYQLGESWIPPADRLARSMPDIQLPIPKVASLVPKDGPYFAAKEAGLLRFWQNHPEGDGRGVRIALFDSGFDLLHPALRSSIDQYGNPVPKLKDVVVMTAPEADSGWVRFGEPLLSSNGSLIIAGRTWAVPYDSTFRFGVFNRKIHLADWLGQNDTHIRSIEISVGVLWDEKTNRFWVDTDGDGSFANQRALRDYGDNHDIDYLGGISETADNRIPFTIKVDITRSAAYIAISDSSHGTMVAGALAANHLTGGLLDGAAPNAQLIDARNPSRNFFLPSILRTLARPDVDLGNWSGLLGLQSADGRNDFIRLVLERTLAVYDKPMACICSANRALLVLDYQSPEMLRRNRQLPPPYAEVSSETVPFVPGGNGFVNMVLAPSTSLLPESRYRPSALRWQDGRMHITRTMVNSPAPDGYKIGDNPSPTIPVVTGVLADLISEARRQHVRFDARRLTRAVLMGARLVPGIPTSRQGFGVVDAAGAWDRLTRMVSADDPRSPVLTYFTVFRRQHGKLKPVEGLQDDLANAEGTVYRDLWITRQGGYPSGRLYRLALRGNDGTFTLLNQKIVLDHKEPHEVRLSIRISPGLHLAFLQLFDAKADVEMEEIPLLLRAPEPGKPVSFATEKHQASVAPLNFVVHYFRLPSETQAAHFQMEIPSDNPPPVSFRLMPGFSYGPTTYSQNRGESLDPQHHVGPMEKFESLVSINKSETLALGWGNRGSPEYATPYDAPAPSVPIQGTVLVTRYAVVARRDGRKVRFTNLLAEIKGQSQLYDARLGISKKSGNGPHATAVLERLIPEHTRQWRMKVSLSTPGPTDTDIYLLHCEGSGGACSLIEHGPFNGTNVKVALEDPQPGVWRVVIHRRESDAAPAYYRIREAFLQDSSSPLETENRLRRTHESWSYVLPPKKEDAQYVRFRVANGTEGVGIAMTPLDRNAP